MSEEYDNLKKKCYEESDKEIDIIESDKEININENEGSESINYMVVGGSKEIIFGSINRYSCVNQLVLRSGECVQCYGSHEANRVCRVTVSEPIEIPSQSYAYVSVTIPENEQLPATGFIENFKTTDTNFQVIEGLVDPHSSNVGVGVINKSEENILLHQGESFGLCKSSYEEPEAEVLEYAYISANKAADYDPLSVPEHLKATFEKSSIRLNVEEKQPFAVVLNKYKNIFVTSSDELGCTDKVKHKINTGDAQPIKQAPRRQPLGKRESEKEEVERMLQEGIIEPSDSEWSSPVVLIT
ncbi:uncharacterized protein LOC128548021 [Mercenaria mercenaria]|uniref:uncharacterized protein LOC128548021 n=1 Tax=Mercenaria mercenaria TaxID=6596 RepID=UPI00234E86E3|nr:uncharacterized protein LOC128548021 [Mercenaria mercenaria]